MNSVLLAQSVVSGLLFGAVYGLTAMGLTLIFGVLRVLNFAHGVFTMLGMYIGFWLWKVFGLDPFLSLLVTIPALFLLGVLFQRFAVQRMLDAPEYNQLLLTLGAALFLENLALVLWSPTPRSVNLAYSMTTFNLGPAVVSLPRLMAAGVALAMCLGLVLLVNKTDLGRALRAAAEERRGAQLVGVDVFRVFAITFGIGAACAGAAGSALISFFYVTPEIGNTLVLFAFVVVVLGGMGSFVGALLGGLIVGLAEGLGAVFLPGSLRELVIFGLFLLILLFRPSGLLGKKGA